MKQPIAKKKKKHGKYSTFTVTVSLSLALGILGLFGAILLHGEILNQYLKEHVELHVYLRSKLNVTSRIKLQKILGTKEYIRKINNVPQVKFISSEEAFNEFISRGQEDFRPILKDVNPLKSSLILNIDPNFTSVEQLKNISKQIEQSPEVAEVAFNEQLEVDLQAIQRNIGNIGLFLVLFAFIALAIILTLMNNTIRLALYSQRFLIRSMKLVGATDKFIRKPFLKRAISQGLLAGVIAAFLTFITLKGFYYQIPDLQNEQVSKNILLLLGLLPIIGASVSFLSSNWAINRYLRLSLDELY